MGVVLDHIHGHTYHGRHGDIDNSFRYGFDYVACDLDSVQKTPLLFSRNKFNLTSLYDKDHGGERTKGDGADWVRTTLVENGLSQFLDSRIVLLAQPRVFGHVFNPVAFWLIYHETDDLRVVIAEVNNTFGDRHSYLCHNDDLSMISKSDRLTARKVFHVSPFQPVTGEYTFRFDIGAAKVGIWIDYKTQNGGVLATFVGTRKTLSNGSILSVCLRRPFGSLRVIGLIYWQALKLKLKGGEYRSRPEPPKQEVSR